MAFPWREGLRPTGRFGAGVVVDAQGIAGGDGEIGEFPPPLLRIWYPSAATRAELAAAGFRGLPVVIGTPGWDGTRVENTALVRELVSHGFVVATLEYPAPALDPDHVTAPMDQRRLRRPMDFSSEAAFKDTVRRGDALTRARARDASAVLDRLTGLNASDPGNLFTQRLDLERTGVFGFSLGGAVAAQACWQDGRFRAAVNMDGWQFAEAAREGLRQPYLLLSDDAPLPGESDLAASDPGHRYTSTLTLLDYQRTVRSFRKHGGLYVRISGSQHLNFAGQATLLQRLKPGVNVRRLFGIVNAFVLAFFRKHLDGIDSPLLSGGSTTIPEAHVQAWIADEVRDRALFTG